VLMTDGGIRVDLVIGYFHAHSTTDHYQVPMLPAPAGTKPSLTFWRRGKHYAEAHPDRVKTLRHFGVTLTSELVFDVGSRSTRKKSAAPPSPQQALIDPVTKCRSARRGAVEDLRPGHRPRVCKRWISAPNPVRETSPTLGRSVLGRRRVMSANQASVTECIYALCAWLMCWRSGE
jgi:hypothetical protein